MSQNEKKEEQNPTEEEGYYEQHEIIVDPKQTPLRLDKFLMDKLSRVSRNRIQAAIKAGAITVNNKEIKPNFKVKHGHTVNVVLPRANPADYEVTGEDLPLDIRYEDDDLLVVHKAPGMVVHPGIGNRNGTLVNALKFHFDNLPTMEGNSHDRVGLVHRIDKDTSGLLVIAKTELAMTHLAKQFFDHSIERTYHALVWGEPDELEGTIDCNIGRHPRIRNIYTTFPEEEEGKHAITHYKVIDPMYYVSLIECKLETGRTHQIRVHMKHLGHPVFSDKTYGGDTIRKGTVFSKYKQFVHNTFKVMPRQALHARSLGFIHPSTGEKMYFEAELPEDFQAAMDRWRAYLSAKKIGE